MRNARFPGAVLVCSIAGIAAAQPPAVEAYGRLPAIGSVGISPDGKRLALSVGFEYSANEPDRDLTALRVLNLETGKIEHTLSPPRANTLRYVGWADDKRAYYYISAAADANARLPSSWAVMSRGPRLEFWRTGVLAIDSGASTLLMQHKEFSFSVALANLQAPIEGDPGFGRMIAWSPGVDTNGSLGVYRVNLDNGSASPMTTGNVETRDYLLDESGAVIARVEINDYTNRWRLFVFEDGKERLILEDVSEMGRPLSFQGLLQDGRIAAVDPHEEGARDTLLAIDRKTGAKEPLHKTGGSDVGAIGDPWFRRVVGVGWIEDLPKQKFFDEQLQGIYTSVQQYFADGYVRLVSWSRDRSNVLVFGEKAGDAGAYYMFDPTEKKLRSVGKTYPALTTAEALGERRAIKYKSRDGTSIPAYLTLPAGVEAKNLPLVLLVHGGPHARDNFTFDWWASFLASRGYAVLQANYRGSTGYGYDWFNAGRGGWGDGVMQTDVEDGADALVKGGTVDPKRICIIGASYGGYAALAGATLTPDRYACAASINGLTDPMKFQNDARSGNLGKRAMISEWWRKSMGDDQTHLKKITPVDHADKVKAPILIVHGVDDSVVPIEQARWMNSKLKREKKNVRYIELKGDDHWLSGASTRTQMLRELETFLGEHIGRGGVAAAKTAMQAGN